LSETSSSFPKQARLLKGSEFKRVFDDPLKQFGPGVLVFARVNDLGRARLGLAISKKCAKSAVQRNRIKRLVRESFRRLRLELPGADFVVLCRAGAADHPNDRFNDVVTGLFTKLGRRICEKS
jgi:ribonuclease P protein component